MTYKYMEKQVEGAKALAEKYPHMQTHQDIYKEHVEVLEKAKAFDRIKDEGDYASDAEEYVNIVSYIIEDLEREE
ncbi:hypothetical protein [Staphylococcus simulans]|uniref:hypothetical protein n=1 Tax=Staphylococcus simulans TaxID=1286 RepID=UPI003CF52ECF